MANESDIFYEAAKRLDILLSGTSHDVFAADVFYHKNCYPSHTLTRNHRQKQPQVNWRAEFLNVLMRCLGEVLSKTKNHIS